jgi:endonuclease YncB( thermonuclease family)
MIRRLITLVCLCFVAAWPAAASDTVAGPVRADVVRVVDGDTIEVSAHLWVSLRLSTRVRIRGIDTPEMRGDCPEEKALAAAARDRLAELAGPSIRITNIEDDKYGGRVVADATATDGSDLAVAMIASNLARTYNGEGARADWCLTGGISN